jgi:diguanylate cyclase (GGDEF)-like protein
MISAAFSGNANLDPLTGAYARDELAGSLGYALAQMRDADQPLSLLILDLDYFKSINDAFGHTRGDRVLIEFAQRARTVIRASDVLVRYGGDEFVVILPATDRQQALALATRLLDTIRHTAFDGDPPLSLSLTIGSATFPDDGASAEVLFECADRRLLAAKRQGRGRVVIDDLPVGELLGFAASSRLVEREVALDMARSFLDELPTRGRGSLAITGAAGVGRSTVLAEIGRLAQARGYSLLALRATSGLRSRMFGAVVEATQHWPDVPSPLAGTEAFIAAIRRVVAADHPVGLLITLDDFPDLDRASLDLLRDLFAASLPVVGLVWTTQPGTARRVQPVDIAWTTEIDLAPLSMQGLRVTLRGTLQWEPPVEVCDWLYRQTAGLPALLKAALKHLIDRGVLVKDGAGWDVRGQVAAVPLDPALHVARQPRPQNLPTSTTSFVGREREIRALKHDLATERLLTIVGPGGIGKTRLAVQIAAEVVDQFAHGAWFVSLADIAAADHTVYAIATALGITLHGTRSPREQVLAHLRDRELLLVIDNVEHVLPGVDLLATLLDHAPGLRVLATSRERLALPGEIAVELGGFGAPEPDGAVDVVRSGAAQVFVQSANRALRSYTLTPDDEPYVEQICRMVGGMPLGLELAAAWTPLFSCREIAEQIADNLDFLASAPTGQQHNLRAVFEYFWRQLSADEQRVVRALGVFRGGFDRLSARDVAGASPFLLAALVDKAFLWPLSGARYTMHKLLQQYAEEQLRGSPADARDVPARHAAQYLRLAQEATTAMLSDEQTRWLDRIEAEHDNMRAVLTWSLAHAGDEPKLDRGLRLAAALGQFWRVRGHCTEGREWIKRLLNQPHVDSLSSRADALRWAGILAQEQGDYPEAQELLDQRLRLAEANGDQAAIADTLAYLGWIASVAGEYEQSGAFLEESVAIAREIGDLPTLVHALNNLGNTLYRQAEFDRSFAVYREAIDIARELGDRHAISDSLLGLGNNAIRHDDYAAAAAHYHECLHHAREIGDRRRIGEALGNLGGLASRNEDYPAALRYFEECYDAFQSIGDQLDVAMLLGNLGALLLQTGDQLAAQRRLVECIELSQEIGAQPLVLSSLARLADLRARAGNAEQALEWLEVVIAHPATGREHLLEIEALVQGIAQSLEGDRAEAAQQRGRARSLDDALDQALAVFRSN